MATDFDNSSDFEDESLPVATDIVAQPSKLLFAPWHAPRKQVVRKQQWVHHATKTIGQQKSDGVVTDGDTIRYLTLPGPDLLDVRLMADVCRNLGVKLRYTGFCHTSEEEIGQRLRRNVSEFSIEWDDVIQEASIISNSRLEDVEYKTSPSRTVMERGGPYDCINIDACQPLAKHDQDQTGRLIDTIRQILEYQLNHMRQPWLLYLTSPVQIDSISPNSMQAFHSQILTNANGCARFASELARYFADQEQLQAFLSRSSSADGFDLLRTTNLGITKWFLHMAEQADFRCVQLDTYCYSTFRKPPFDPNMLSTCYIFLPLRKTLIDQSGLTENRGLADRSARNDHLKAIDKSFNMRNLDEMLSSSPELLSQFANETKELLREVGYDVDDAATGYDTWVASEPNIFTGSGE